MLERRSLDVRGRVVVITGAAGGIGAALARRFGRAGAQVALLDRDAAGLDPVAAGLAVIGAPALAIRCDVTSLDDCHAAIDAVAAAWGGVDVLVNNAGITHVSRFRDTDVEVIRRVMDVNFFGAVNATSAALSSLLEHRGQIVVLSSVAGFAPLALRSGYAASKHALHGFFDSLRAELHGTGIGITLVCPSFVRTGIGEHALGGDGRGPSMPRIETGRPADPADVADAIFDAAVRRRRLLVYSPWAKVSYAVARLSPIGYERLMVRRILRDVR